MGLIHELDYNTVVKIAAGEVIDRPASVVRELIDNSVDAGADLISVHLSSGGISYLEIQDNGKGMDKADLVMSWKNHTTSKISSFSDLESLHTLGFRGEALSSIAEVAELTILSKTDSELSGHELSVWFGAMEAVNERGLARGTVVIVKNLFENLPARKKFLSTPASELKLIDKEIVKKALAFPNISFELVNEGKRKYLSPSRKTFFERISDFFPDAASSLLPVEYSGKGFTLNGFISKPDFIRPNRMYQYFLVNNRAVEWKHFFFAVSNAYGSLIPRGFFPAVFLYMNIEPALVDVNVHPMKREVRFENDSKIGREVQNAIAQALGAQSGLTEADSGGMEFSPFEKKVAGAISDYMVRNSGNVSIPSGWESIGSNSAYQPKPVQPEETLFQTFTPQTGEPVVEESLLSRRFAGSLFRTYLLFEAGDYFVILDQHAAHERINYEKLRLRYREGGFASQELLEPIRMEVPPQISDELLENLPTLQAMGFDVEHFGGPTFVIRSTPEYIDYNEAADVVMGFVETLEERHDAHASDFIDAALKQMACKSSVRAGDAVSKEEALALVSEWEKTPNRQSCPHGRPVIIKMTRLDLEKMFKRTGF